MTTIENLSDNALKDLAFRFIREFEENGELKYRLKLSQMLSGGRSLIIDAMDLMNFDLDFTIQIQKTPREQLEIFDKALIEAIAIESPEYSQRMKGKVHVRIRNLAESTQLRRLDSFQLGKLVMTTGIVTKSHAVKSLALVAGFKCIPNGHLNIKVQDFYESQVIVKPYRCSEDNCDAQKFQLDKKHTRFTEYQNITIQEMPEELTAGEIPRAYEVLLFDDMVDRARPGDRVSLTATLEAVNDSQASSPSQVFENKLFCNYIEVVGRRIEDLAISREEEESFLTASKHILAFTHLIQSFCPTVLGQDLAKEACLLQAASSPQRTMPDGTVLRGDISVLLVGDPGIAKSQMLKFAVNVSPRGRYITGMMSSAAGIGAAVVKEPNGSFALEAGAAVLTDLGLLAIDEIQKLQPENMNVLNELMEQQTVSISKAGINVNLNARTSILAAMNPVDYRYNPYASIIDNIGVIPIPLLTRFDVILVLKDDPDPENDEAISNHIGKLRMNGTFPNRPPMDQDFLKRYLIFARKFEPKLKDSAFEILKGYYKNLRRSSDPNALTVTPRWLEALIRLTIARARLLLKSEAEDTDAEGTLSFMDRMLKCAFMDPNTKKIDIGIIYNKPLSEASLRESALAVFKELSGEEKKSVKDTDFFDALCKGGKFNQEQAEKVFQDMWKAGVIFEHKPHQYKKA